MTCATSNLHFSPAMTARLAVIVALAAGAMSHPAGAQSNCGDRPSIARQLKEGFAEIPTTVALMADGQLLEVFKSPAGTTWTIVASSPQGRSCIVAAGRDWIDHREAPVLGLEASWTPRGRS
jgi:hypothetical protein